MAVFMAFIGYGGNSVAGCDSVLHGFPASSNAQVARENYVER